jgi:hypothetical protein
MDESIHSPWRCNDCHTIFAGERALDSMRRAEIAVLSTPIES